jgi:CubicO group peptidase (beta-lactamase class C family)
MKKGYIVAVGIVTVLVAAIFMEPHLLKTLYYNFPGIYDYTFYENHVIAPAVNPSQWQKASTYNTKDFPDSTQQLFAKYETEAFIVIQNKELIYEKYWLGRSPDDISNSFSAAKSIVSLLIGAAIDDGKIKSVGQPVADFVPEFKGKDTEKITIKHLLTMSSGLNWNESYINPFSATTKAYYGSNVNALVTDLKLITEPGVTFKYLSGNTQLLAMIIKRSTGMSVAEYAERKLWQPLQAQDTALWMIDEQGMERAYCCFNATAGDYARLGQLVLDSGRWLGEQIVPKDYIEEAISPAIFLTDKGNPVDFYGYQFWIVENQGQQIPYFRGILGQYIFILPQYNAVVVRLGHERGEKKEGDQHPQDVYLYLDAALQILGKKSI